MQSTLEIWLWEKVITIDEWEGGKQDQSRDFFLIWKRTEHLNANIKTLKWFSRSKKEEYDQVSKIPEEEEETHKNTWRN